MQNILCSHLLLKIILLTKPPYLVNTISLSGNLNSRPNPIAMQVNLEPYCDKTICKTTTKQSKFSLHLHDTKRHPKILGMLQVLVKLNGYWQCVLGSQVMILSCIFILYEINVNNAFTTQRTSQKPHERCDAQTKSLLTSCGALWVGALPGKVGH